MKRKIQILKKQLIKTTVTFGIILIVMGLLLQYEEAIINYILAPSNANSLNLNLAEVDTYYNNSSSMDKDSSELAYHKDLSWGWPAASEYYLSTYYSSSHPAIDIVPTNGDYNIYAASSGTVVTSTYKWDGGNYYVIKQDNGYYSLYCHLSQKIVKEGDKVSKGQVIGIMGRSGLATGVHLHYSIWDGYPYYGGHSINPLNFY